MSSFSEVAESSVKTSAVRRFFVCWPIARTALMLMFRQKLFWVLYILALLNFLVFFAGIYLFSQIEENITEATNSPTAAMSRFWLSMKQTIQKDMKLSGDAETFRNFYFRQGYFVMVVFALAGTLLIGNDYRMGSLGFYLAKPLGKWDYLSGKFLAVAGFTAMQTIFPAALLWLQCYLLMEESTFAERAKLIPGIVGYGLAIALVLGVLVLALSVFFRRTTPLIMVWIFLLALCPLLATMLVDRLGFSANWRLIDIWNDLYIVGSRCLGIVAELSSGRGVKRPQPDLPIVLCTLGAIVFGCLLYLHVKLKAVEVVK